MLLLILGLAAPAGAADGRYVIVTVPLGLASEDAGTAVLLDTTTGRSWHIMLDDKGRPRWRGVEFMGGSQGQATPPAPTDPAGQNQSSSR